MKTELFPFQKKALLRLRNVTAEALGSFHRTHTPQIIAFTAPTGAGKTIILAALIEDIYFGDEQYAEQPDAIFVWLSDSPELNEQSRGKIDLKADRIRLDQCVTISDNSFDSEFLEDGHIYFLNTQKLGKSSNLTKHSDSRQYTIWETLRNTAREKADRLYFVIDEAHRGMQGREAGKATTIMQKFIKGSTEDGLAPMPIVIGMSATIERFYALAADTPSTTQKASVTPDEVRASGLLKDRIVITYPDETLVNKDMGVLQAAADEWKDKWEHWAQYCTEQHYAQVNPVFVVQVQNGSGDKISDTDLDDCLRKIEERTGFHFQAGEVVHTFGQMSGSLSINGLDVRCEEPSRIAEDRNIKVVFFKENLSTGWDCPRAETMMSFRRAGDATYIAQLLGRMVRTPMQMHIQVDDTLNDVHLYLPWFDQATVQNVVDALQSSEGGNIPTDIYEEGINERKFDTLTVKPLRTSSTGSGRREVDSPQQIHIEEPPQQPEGEDAYETFPLHTESRTPTTQQEQTSAPAVPADETKAVETSVTPSAQMPGTSPEAESRPEETFNREDVVRAINDAGLLTYDVRSLRINNYQISLYKMARLLSHCGLYPDAAKDVVNDVVGMIHDYVERLKSEGQYEERVTQAKQFRLSAQIFDVFGKTVDNYQVHDLFSTTDTDIDRQFRRAETKLGNEGGKRLRQTLEHTRCP